MIEPPPPSSNYKPIAIMGYAVILTCFGGVGGWAAFAQIDSSVSARASVALESHLQVVQHLEGGIIKEIDVKEGESVNEGDVLFRLDDTQTRANLDLVQGELDTERAQEARLIAERDQAPSVTFPSDLMDRASDSAVDKIMTDQKTAFEERRTAIDGQVSILRNRQAALRDEIEGLKRERESAEQQLFYINDELTGVVALADKGLVSKTRKNSLEREKARLDGVLGRNDIDAAKANDSINEMELQIQSLQQKFQEDVASSLQDVREKVSDLTDRQRVALDAEHRNDLLAPRSGVVQNLKVTTVGQVLRPGDVLLEIAPINDQLVVEAQIQPVDVDSVHSGMTAEVRFPSFHSRTTPLILGKVDTVSHDRLIDEASHQPYFLAQIAVSNTDIPPEMKDRLRAGMPAEVIFPTGERTALEYLVHPMREALSNTFQEK